MLVLTRTIGEKIVIDKGQIQLKILYMRNGKVAIGIKAPAHIDINYEEIYLKKLAEGVHPCE